MSQPAPGGSGRGRGFVALLRGVNVGKFKRVPMADFRALLEGLGYLDSKTLLNSGNAVFRVSGDGVSGASLASGPAHAQAIAEAILARLSIEVPVIVKSAPELAAIVDENPFANTAADHSRLLVAFAQDTQALVGLQGIAALLAPEEGFFIGQHAAYLHCANGILASQAGSGLLGKAGQALTTRNWATTLKLHALVSAIGQP